MSNPQFDQQVDGARKALYASDPRQASGALRRAARAPGLEADDERLKQMLALWVRVASALGFHELAAKADQAQSLVPQAMFDAGWQLVEVGLAEVAVPILRWCDRKVPGNPAVRSELALALRDSGDPAGAAAMLKGGALEAAESRLLLAECAMLAGDLALAAEHVAAGAGSERGEVVAGALARAARLGELPARDLRGWHYALTGGVLLHRSPYGFDDGMNGRFAFTQDSPARIRLGLERAAGVLGVWDRIPRAVCGMPDAGSQVVALAAAALFGLPMAEPGPGVLRVAYDLDRVAPDALEFGRQSGSLLHVHTACWTSPPSVAPDTLTALHQVNVAPWDGGVRIDPASGRPTEQPVSTDPPATWAQRVLEADPSTVELLPDDGDAELAAFAERAPPATGARRFWAGGPVGSSRFG